MQYSFIMTLHLFILMLYLFVLTPFIDFETIYWLWHYFLLILTLFIDLDTIFIYFDTPFIYSDTFLSQQVLESIVLIMSSFLMAKTLKKYINKVNHTLQTHSYVYITF